MTRLTHYFIHTPDLRPFLSGPLCDLAGTGSDHRMTSDWSDVTCPGCHAIGPAGARSVLALSDGVLVSLGAQRVEAVTAR